MHRFLTVRRPWVVAMGMLVVFAVLIWLAFPGAGRGGGTGIKKAPLYRLAANSGNSVFSASIGSPRLFYDRTLPVKSTTYKALYVTVAGTAHQTNGDILALACTLNGSPCDSYGLGKVRVGNTGANSWESNSFSQTWCVTPTGTEQQLRLILVAEGVPPPTNTVYIEHVNVIVDASSTTDACSTQGFIAP